MNVEIGAVAALFPEKKYINGIAVAVYAFYQQSLRSSIGLAPTKVLNKKNLYLTNFYWSTIGQEA